MPLRYLTAGESHGPAITCILEGVPAGLPLAAEDIDRELARRQGGYGRGRRMAIERDRVEILSGVRFGRSLGSPIALLIRNKEWPRWERAMAVAPWGEGEAPGEGSADWRLRPVTRPRPGHADLAGALKYGTADARDILERASARETAMRVAAGAVAKQLLARAGIQVFSHVVRIGEVAVEETREVCVLPEVLARAEESPVRCIDRAAGEAMIAAIDRARAAGDTLGGVFEVVAYGVPPGLGAHVHWDRRLDARLAAAVMSIPAIKGVEIGLGFAAAARPGSAAHDPIEHRPGRGFARPTNRAGGLEGGMTNGQPVVVRAAMKPLATLYRPLPSVDLVTKEPAPGAVERSDTTAVPAAAVVGEAVVAWELAVALMEKFGGDSLPELLRHLRTYYDELAARDAWRPPETV